MAPEVMDQTGHDYSADIWSVGVTAIELAQGQAPLAELPAMKVILSIINGPPPALGTSRPWDKAFRDFVEDCLQKDPTKRPTIDQIFERHKKFFSKAKDAKYLKEHFIMDLKEVYLRRDSSLIYQAEEYLNNKAKMRVERI
jgi:serine/threonine-protein kinase OSR1/STK39